MGLKNWLFGDSRKEDSGALATLKAQINKYEHEGRNLERQADEQKVLASKMLQAGNKSGARQALKRRTVYTKRLNTVHNMLMNLQAQMDSIQTAKSTVDTVKAMDIGTKIVDQQFTQISPEKAEQVMDKVITQRDKLEMMTETLTDSALSDGILGIEDDNAIDDQLAQLEAEMELGTTTSLPDLSGLPATPSGAAKEEDDTSELEAELEGLRKKVSNSDKK